MFFKITEANPANKPTNMLKINTKFLFEMCLYLQIKNFVMYLYLGILKTNKKILLKQDLELLLFRV